MALRTVTGSKNTQGTYVYTSKMAVGDSTEGYYIGTKAGKFGDVIVLENKAGQALDVLTSGSLRYLQKDAETDASKKLIAGQYTVITKSASYKGKDGRPRNIFTVQQDSEMTKTVGAITEDATTAAATTTAGASVAERLAKVKKVS